MTTIMIAMGATVLILFMMAAALSTELCVRKLSVGTLIMIIFSVVIAVAGIVAVWFFAFIN